MIWLTDEFKKRVKQNSKNTDKRGPSVVGRLYGISFKLFIYYSMYLV